ncbi:MAG: tripartite tricarboxylate transporter TctB family protein [Geminicoccaceae bacterium]|nr:tripartite tricarboxylate transporter TctB family protein [Geminicoccaceae bacterium]
MAERPSEPHEARPRIAPDLMVGLAILVFCGVAYGVTLTFDRAPAALAQNVQPATFPRLVIIVIAVLTVIMMVSSRALPPTHRAPIKPMVFASAGVMVAFVLGFAWLGILPAMILLCLGLPLLWGERRLALVVPFAVVFPTLVYLLFAEVLEVYFEPSPLVFW